MSAIIEELNESIDKKVEEKFKELNNKGFENKSRITEVLMDKEKFEITDDVVTRNKKIADVFVNEYLRTGRISDKSFDYYNTATATEGGNLIPQDLYERIIKKANTMCAIRGLATVRPTTVNDVEFVVEKGGVIADWSSELADKVDTEVEGFDKVIVSCHDLYAIPSATNRMLSDNAFDLEAYIVEKLAQAFVEKSGLAYIKGTGVGQPKGLITDLVATELVITKEVTFKELNELVYSLKQKYATNGSWVMSRKTLGEINGLTTLDAAPVFRQPELRQEGTKVDGYLLNYPVFIDDNMPDIKTAKAGEVVIVFGDIKSAMVIVDNVNVFTKRDDITKVGFTKFPSIIRTGSKRILDEAVVALKQK